MGNKSKLFRILISSLSVIIIIVTIFGTLGFFGVFLPGKTIYDQVILVQSDFQELKLAISDKDLDLVKQKIDKIDNRIKQIENKFQHLSLLDKLPITKNYYHDGLLAISIAKDTIDAGNIILTAVEPYQDFLGLKGARPDAGKTTQDRIAFLTQSIENLIPHLNSIETKAKSVNDSINQIDPNRYPKLKNTLLKAQELVADTYLLIKNGQPLLQEIPWLLGKSSPRTYLLLFQNDAELRPTGGFWTAYGLISVANGKVTPLGSADIYQLDALLGSSIPAPRPIKTYHINVPYWNIRDMNTSPDVPTSIKLFLEKYNQIYKNKDKIDAVIALDTQVLVDIVKVIGRVGVPGWGNFSADPDKRCDGCPQIIYQLEWLAGRPRNYLEKDRKGFLSPLIHSLLSNAMGAEKNKIPPLTQAFFNNVSQKHLLFYFVNPDIQKAAENANIAGKIIETPTDFDYLHLSQANMSSAKTNLFLKQKIKHEIISQNNKIEHKITVTYQNPSRASNCNLEKGDLCLNAPKYREWFRFFVNPGSSLIKMTGSEVEPVVYDELGKKVFEGFFGDKYPLYAQSSLKTSIQYQSGTTPGSHYALYLQKQPGTKPIDYQLFINGQEFANFAWTTDRTVKIPLP